MTSPNSLFNKFWQSGEGQLLMKRIEESCSAEDNDDLSEHLLMSMFARDIDNLKDARRFLRNVYKSLKRIVER